MSCMKVTMTREGGMKATMERRGGMKTRMALVCGSSLGMAALVDFDGRFITTVDGKYILVKKALR